MCGSGFWGCAHNVASCSGGGGGGAGLGPDDLGAEGPDFFDLPDSGVGGGPWVFLWRGGDLAGAGGRGVVTPVPEAELAVDDWARESAGLGEKVCWLGRMKLHDWASECAGLG